MYTTVPKAETKKRDIWDAPTLFHAIEVCEDDRLKLAINLAFACSLRIGELLGLTWDCVDISPESFAAGKASVYVNKELQRVNKNAMKTLEKKDVLRVFPELRESNKTVLVLKKPKIATSARKIFLPQTVTEVLVEWKRDQELTKEALGSEYMDFNLVMANGLGMPTEQSRITALFSELIEKNDFDEDGICERNEYKRYFRESLSIDVLISENLGEEETILDILDLLVDVCCSKRSVIRIAGDDKPLAVVKSRFMKLNAEHIRYVLKCLSENTTRVRNIRQYLLTALYNAPATIRPFYQTWVNNDMATGQF